MQQLSAQYARTTTAYSVSACQLKNTKHLAHLTEKMCGGLANNAYQHWWPLEITPRYSRLIWWKRLLKN